MTSTSPQERYQSVIALDTLTKKGQNWAELLEAKAIPALVGLLKPDVSKQPIRARYLGHLTGYQPIRDQYFLIWSVPAGKLPKLGYKYSATEGPRGRIKIAKPWYRFQ